LLRAKNAAIVRDEAALVLQIARLPHTGQLRHRPDLGEDQISLERIAREKASITVIT
jgi:hypothetical protein